MCEIIRKPLKYTTVASDWDLVQPDWDQVLQGVTEAVGRVG